MVSLQVLYAGSVKDVYQSSALQRQLVFGFTDHFSVFDWGRMPDTIPNKGKALCIIAGYFFEKFQSPTFWKEVEQTPEGEACLNTSYGDEAAAELKDLQSQGLKTHYRGMIDLRQNRSELHPTTLRELQEPLDAMVVDQVSVMKPKPHQVAGASVYDYSETRQVHQQAKFPRLLPWEVIFRWGCPTGSSLLKRHLNLKASALMFFENQPIEANQRWKTPVVEVFTKLEDQDRPLELTEAMAIAAVEQPVFKKVVFRTLWVSAGMAYLLRMAGLELWDGKLEWAVSETGAPILVDALGPDEFRIMKRGVSLSKEFLREFYRKTPWFQGLEAAKVESPLGDSSWRKKIKTPVPHLPQDLIDLTSQMYCALADIITGQKWFSEKQNLEKILERIAGQKK